MGSWIIFGWVGFIPVLQYFLDTKRTHLGYVAFYVTTGCEIKHQLSCAAPVHQASGVTVSDEVIKVFNDMKVRKSSSSEDVKKRKKAVLFCLSDDKKKIIVEEDKQILVGDIGESVDDPYASFVKLLPLNDCRYGLYDATYETKESKKEDLVFIFWYVCCLDEVVTFGRLKRECG